MLTEEQNYSHEVFSHENSLPDDLHALEMEKLDAVDSEEVRALFFAIAS